jgi:hypothetical protein
LTDRVFTERVIERYHELRNTNLSNEALFYKIDHYEAKLGDAIIRNDERWPYEEHSFRRTEEGFDENRFKHSYSESIQMLKEFIEVRGAFLDENIEQLRQHIKN